MSPEEREKVMKILKDTRTLAGHYTPWFAPALFACKIHLTTKVPLAGIDKNYNIFWNPEFILKLDAGEITYLTIDDLIQDRQKNSHSENEPQVVISPSSPVATVNVTATCDKKSHDNPADNETTKGTDESEKTASETRNIEEKRKQKNVSKILNKRADNLEFNTELKANQNNQTCTNDDTREFQYTECKSVNKKEKEKERKSIVYFIRNIIKNIKSNRLKDLLFITYPTNYREIFERKNNEERLIKDIQEGKKPQNWWSMRYLENYFKYKSIPDYYTGLAFLWVHEISHVLRRHWERAKLINADPVLWNIAADLEINDADWMCLPPPNFIKILEPYDFGLPVGKTAEFYYQELKNFLVKNNTDVERYYEKYKNLNEGSGIKGIPDTYEEEFIRKQQNKEEFKSSKNISQKSKIEKYNLKIYKNKSEAEIESFQNLTELHKRIIEKSTAEFFFKYVIKDSKKEKKISKNYHYHEFYVSTIGMAKWAEKILITEEIHRSNTNWKNKLRACMKKIALESGFIRIDYSLSRPHRRSSVYYPLIIPGHKGNLSLRICVVLDTSGSMGEENYKPLKHAISEILKIIRDYDTNVTIIPCDVKAYQYFEVDKISGKKKIISNLYGGGGTDMRKGIEAALQINPKPDIIVVLTDGITPYTIESPIIPTVFCILYKYQNHLNTIFSWLPEWAKKSSILVQY